MSRNATGPKLAYAIEYWATNEQVRPGLRYHTRHLMRDLPTARTWADEINDVDPKALAIVTLEPVV